ncbi:MAG TPA: PBP1A family penicillin-binding protein [Bryobacteraceae bacterium]|nr:PBP1A family penicillin-binding protein [Bryobacteraceae bacterium]
MFLPTPDGPVVNDQSQPPKKKAWRDQLVAWLKIPGVAAGIPLAAGILLFGVFYVRCSRQIDRELQAGVFSDAVNIYASPLSLSDGDTVSEEGLTAELDMAGYRRSQTGGPLSWRMRNSWVEIFADGSNLPARVQLSGGQVARIFSGGKEVREVFLASPLITTLSSKKEERLLVKFRDIPDVLVKAVLSAEDKRFFQHDGLDFPRIVKAAYADVREGRKGQGASTITMQLVRGLWLEPDKRWLRKFSEAMMTIHLEQEWSKQKIFETYANQVYLGRQADYSLHGFGEGARMFFGKKLADVSLAEAALLAGMVQRPSSFNPFRYPERAQERRDLVLSLMRNNRYITDGQYEAAVQAPIRVARDSLSEARAPYFLDLVNEQLQEKGGDAEDRDVRNVYSTIDLNLQRAADEAVTAGMNDVDQLLAKRSGKSGAKPEAALIAIDPHSGEIKAIVGGRDYKRSQLNRILAKRPPGSVFKPFVYAAALDTAISGGATVFTPASMVDDSPTTFWFDGRPYQPGNFRGESFGTMTLQDALARSDNVAAVKVAQDVGYGAVVRMARRFGLNDDIHATPAVALGAYQVTPLEIAGAYTAFANGGIAVKPVVVNSYRDTDGAALRGGASQAWQVLDPRINWLMVNMLEEVMRSGTAAGVRSRGFTQPAAGKTGTSHDGWFAGFTTKLLCVVWVGFDDYRELGLEGAKSALPIWTEFMKRASRMGAYRDAKEFPMVNGITQARICLQSGKLAGDQCPDTRVQYFISGTQPTEQCDMHQNTAPPEQASAEVSQTVATAQP